MTFAVTKRAMLFICKNTSEAGMVILEAAKEMNSSTTAQTIAVVMNLEESIVQNSVITNIEVILHTDLSRDPVEVDSTSTEINANLIWQIVSTLHIGLTITRIAVTRTHHPGHLLCA